MKLLIVSVLLIIGVAISGFHTDNNYTKEIGSHWELAERSSTLEDKTYYINNFVIALENLHYEGRYNAIFYKNQNNSFDYNLKAVKSLQKRLNELKTIDPNSFAYQTAIQQITAQEQGEAHAMLSVFRGCYFLDNNIIWWDWISAILVLILVIMLCVSIFKALDFIW